MSWLSTAWKSIFKPDVFKIILGMLKKILLYVLGRLADDLMEIVLEEVNAAEQLGLTGIDKHRIVFDKIIARIQYKDLPKNIINLCIEGAVLLVKLDDLLIDDNR